MPTRRDDPELMDAPGLPEAEVQEAYRVLGKVNRQLGNLRTIRREFRRFLRDEVPKGARVTLLDVGSGSGDIPKALQGVSHEGPLEIVALDRDPTAVVTARRRSLDVVRGDALRLPFADQSIDLVIAVKFAHHFSGASLDRLLGEMARVAARRIIVLDIRRHWLAYWGFWTWSRLFTRNRLVRYDGPLSVLRGFSPEEMRHASARFSDFEWTVRASLGFQLILIGQRVDHLGDHRSGSVTSSQAD